MDYAALRGAIKTHFKTQEEFANALGMSQCSLSKKLNGKTEWTADEIRAACELLDIDPKDIAKYFFCPKS